MDDLARHLLGTGVAMSRMAAASASSTVAGEAGWLLNTVHAVFLGERLLGLYRKEERAIVIAHQMRQADVYAGLTWQKTTHAHSGRQVWTCDVHGETITMTIESRRVE
jgi:hypothetical protein